MEDVSEKREKTWLESCRLLAWAKNSLTLSNELVSTMAALKDWVTSRQQDVELGRPELLTEILVMEVPLNINKLALLKNIVVQFKKICKPFLVEHLDKKLELYTKNVQNFISYLKEKKVSSNYINIL